MIETPKNFIEQFQNFIEHIAGVMKTLAPIDNPVFTGTVQMPVLQLTSDSRKKINKQPLVKDSAILRLQQINGVSYYLKPNLTVKRAGVIAQEVQKVLPEAINKDSKGYLTVDYAAIVALMIEAIKEQQKEINELKKGISNDIKN